MRIDFICIDSHGEYATGFRVYVNYRHIRGIKRINCEEGYNIVHKKGSFYDLLTIYANEEDVVIEDSAIKIKRPLKSARGDP